MELRISVAELSRVVSLAQGVVQRKNTMPVLSHVLLDVDGTLVDSQAMIAASIGQLFARRENRKTNAEALASLKPAFDKAGTVTAGNEIGRAHV